MALYIFQPQALSSTHVQLDDMSQQPQPIVHYAPLASSPTADGATKQNGKALMIDEDDDDIDPRNNHERRQRSPTSLRRSTSSRNRGRVSHNRSRQSESLTHVYDVDNECTGLITPNGMEVPLATMDQK